MERYAWRAKIKDGCIDEYIRRHNNLWQEIKDVFVQAGIKNYTIWNDGNDLFGYYECEYGVSVATKIQAESPIIAKWNDYMKDILIMEMDKKTGAQPQLTQVFLYSPL